MPIRNSIRRSGEILALRVAIWALRFDRAPYRVDDAGKFDEEPIAGGLNDAALVLLDFRIDQLPSMRLKPVERAFLIR